MLYNSDTSTIIAAGNSKLIYFTKMHSYESFSLEVQNTLSSISNL